MQLEFGDMSRRISTFDRIKSISLDKNVCKSFKEYTLEMKNCTPLGLCLDTRVTFDKDGFTRWSEEKLCKTFFYLIRANYLVEM